MSKQKIVFKYFLESIVYLLFVSQFCANIVPYFHWTIDGDTESIELVGNDENETEEEKETTNEKIHTSLSDLYPIQLELLISIPSNSYKVKYLSIHHPKVSTPPPDFF